MAVTINGTSGITDVDGSAGAPAITGTDTDTGLFFSTNILGLSTGGSERVRVDSSGNVGIGTSSPTNRLSVAAASAIVDITSTTGTSFNGVELKNTSGSFYIGQDNSTGSFYGAGAYGRALYSSGAYPMVFFTNATERMRIDSSGNLGIGTSSPSSKLQVANGALTISDATTHAFLKISPNSGSAAFFDIPTVGSSLLIRTSASSTTDTNSLTITSSGNVNIGSSAYTRRLSVKDTTNTVVVIEGSNSGSSNINFADSDSENPGSINYSHATNYMAFQTAGAERARIDSSGNVGIGTSSPGAKLDVVGASGVITRAAATQDGVELVGRAGGTTSLKVTLTPTTLTASRTLTLPDNTGTVLTTGATVTVAQGGTGATTLTANNVLLGNGTSAVQVVAPGTNGNILTSNGTTWTSGAGNFVSKDVGNLGVGMIAVGIPTSGSTAAGSTASIRIVNLQNPEAGLGIRMNTVAGTWKNIGDITAYFNDPSLGEATATFQRIS